MKKLSPYLMLTALLILTACAVKKNGTKTSDQLAGTWRLNYITGPRITFEGLYPNKKPFLKIETDSNRINGNTSCNNFFGKLVRDGSNISFKEGLGMTKMACPGQGESVFVNTLQKIDKYAISDDGNTLNLISGDIAMMRFEREK